MKNQPQLSKAKEADFTGNKEKSEPFGSDFVVDDTRLELVTSRTSSGCATSCANRPDCLAGCILHDEDENVKPFFPYFRISAKGRYGGFHRSLIRPNRHSPIRPDWYSP